MKLLSSLALLGAALSLAPLASAQHQHAFIWSSSTGMQDLGTLGGDNSYASAINDSGEVTGYSDITGGGTMLSSGRPREAWSISALCRAAVQR